MLTTSQERAVQREVLRSQRIDIEVSVITNSSGLVKHTRQYRFIVSYWDQDWNLIKNYYSPDKFDSYEQAEQEAIRIANEKIM